MESISIPVARLEDAERLKSLAMDGFTRGRELYGHYPPGIDSVEWHEEQIEGGYCHKIMCGDESVGGIYLLPHPDNEMKLNVFFISTKYQGRKIGSRVLELIEASYSDVRRWFLNTPYKDYGNHYLYEKYGFSKIGEFKPDANTDFVLFQYEKQL